MENKEESYKKFRDLVWKKKIDHDLDIARYIYFVNETDIQTMKEESYKIFNLTTDEGE